MAGTFSNTAEGGSEGAAVTTSNSGGASGDAWGYVGTDFSATITYRAAAAYRGTRGIRVRTNNYSDLAILSTASMGAGGFGRLRWYMKMNALPSEGIQLVQPYGLSGGIYGFVGLDEFGRLFLNDSFGDSYRFGTYGVPTNTWVRMEVNWDPSTSSSKAKVGFAIGDSTSYVEVLSWTGMAAQSDTTLDHWQFGKLSYNGSWGDAYVDDVAADSGVGSYSNFIGPSSQQRLKVGSTAVGLRYGSTTPTAVYAGSTQIWP